MSLAGWDLRGDVLIRAQVAPAAQDQNGSMCIAALASSRSATPLIGRLHLPDVEVLMNSVYIQDTYAALRAVGGTTAIEAVRYLVATA